MPKKFTLQEFIERAKKVHGDKYDYSNTEYKNYITKIKVICPKHGEFEITPSDHIYAKCGCKKCSGTEHGTNESFIEKAKKIHGDKYDYSKVDYINNKTKVCIICHEKNILGEEHGEFWQRPNDHITGYSCPKCGNNYIPSLEEWVAKAKAIHGDDYDYSKVEYKGAKTKVCIICPKHGDFFQCPNNHLNGSNCPDCNSNNKSKMEENIAVMLNENFINFERQKTFEWLRHKRHLYLDFYLPEYCIAIEVMGEQHFRPIKRFGGNEYYVLQKKRDEDKEKLCSEHGIKLFYITKNKYHINDILEYIENLEKE